jgi:hypothetical protein
MHTRVLQITHLIHENCGTLMLFAFSQHALARLRAEKFRGSWEYFDKLCFQLPRARAERAALEMAIHLRVLDVEQGKADWICERSHPEGFGILVKKDGSSDRLTFREMNNKIIHSVAFEWDFRIADQPKLICLPADKEHWQRAEIDLVALGAYCGMLMS